MRPAENATANFPAHFGFGRGFRKIRSQRVIYLVVDVDVPVGNDRFRQGRVHVGRRQCDDLRSPYPRRSHVQSADALMRLPLSRPRILIRTPQQRYAGAAVVQAPSRASQIRCHLSVQQSLALWGTTVERESAHELLTEGALMTASDENPPKAAKPRHGQVARSRRASVGRIATLCGLWIAPVLAVLVAVPLHSALDRASVEPSNPLTVPVGSRHVDRAIAVNALVTLRTPPELRSGVDGVVTGLADPGSFEVGEEVFEVNGVGVVTYRGSPLYRDLARGDQGADVSSLSDFLVTIGLLDKESADDRFGPIMEAAVLGFQDRLGVARDGVFRVGYITFVPEGATAINQAVVNLGDRVGAGDAILVAEAPVESVRLTPVSTGSLATYDELELALRIGDISVDIPGAEATGSDARALADSLDEGVSQGAIRVETSDEGTAVYSGSILVLREPVNLGVVPSTAVLIDANGAACVLVETDSGTEPLVVDRPVAGNEVGTVTIDPSAIGLSVLRDASQASRPASCK